MPEIGCLWTYFGVLWIYVGVRWTYVGVLWTYFGRPWMTLDNIGGRRFNGEVKLPQKYALVCGE